MSESQLSSQKRCVLVCQNTSCLNNGSKEVLALFENSNLPEDVTIVAAECQGQCSVGPTVRIIPEETWYCRVTATDVPIIVKQDLHGGERVNHKLHPRIHLSFG